MAATPNTAAATNDQRVRQTTGEEEDEHPPERGAGRHAEVDDHAQAGAQAHRARRTQALGQPTQPDRRDRGPEEEDPFGNAQTRLAEAQILAGLHRHGADEEGRQDGGDRRRDRADERPPGAGHGAQHRRDTQKGLHALPSLGKVGG
jgi:hypothetical protein